MGRNKGLLTLFKVFQAISSIQYIDDFKPQNHHFSQENRNFFENVPIFLPKSSDFSQTVTPSLSRSLPLIAPLIIMLKELRRFFWKEIPEEFCRWKNFGEGSLIWDPPSMGINQQNFACLIKQNLFLTNMANLTVPP